jgi:hypothetical protein
MNDSEYFEKWRYIDSINVYNSIIEEFENYMSIHLQQITLFKDSQWDKAIKKRLGKNSCPSH